MCVCVCVCVSVCVSDVIVVNECVCGGGSECVSVYVSGCDVYICISDVL